jgi:hypothetical protein
VAAVVGKQGKVVLERGGGDHQIHVTDALTNRPESPAFSAEYLARLFINTQNGLIHG